jgi:probable HAF family extracellular repeat protein
VSSAHGISGDGTVIVGSSSSSSGAEAFQWTEQAGIAGLGDLAGGLTSSVAYGISANGRVIVGESSSARAEREAFRWDGKEMKGLGSLALERFNSQAMASSADGSVIIGISARSSVSFEAFRWTEKTGMVGLGDFPGGVTNSNAYGVSPDGRFIVGYGCPGTFDPYTHEAFRWTEQGGLEHLGFAPGLRNSAAYAVSADGNVVVGDNKSERPAVALIWTPQRGMRRLQEVLTNDYKLNLDGWQLTSARGVSHDGKTIVGSGVNSSGQTEGWVVTLKTPSQGKGQQ